MEVNNLKRRDTTLENLTDIPLDQIPVKDSIPPHEKLIKFKDPASNYVRGRDLWGKNKNNDPYNEYSVEAIPTEKYDKFSQGWRMLGGFISCSEFAPNHSSGDRREMKDGNDNDNCARWVLWAAFINPNYAGGGANEYVKTGGRFLKGDDDQYGTRSKLDCNDPNSDWQLLGVYRIDVNNFLEQMGKHLWALETYEYITIYSALDYINGGKCNGTGKNDSSGNALYAALGFTGSGGTFQMKLYSDEKCLYEANNAKITYDDLGWTNEFDMGSGDDKYGYGNDDTLQSYWYSAQESTLTNLNGILDEMRGCMLCLDYPSYQDGEFNGGGYDEDDLINQCWKFWSHSAYACDGDCLVLAHSQGTMSTIKYAGSLFGSKYISSKSGSGVSTSSVASTVFLVVSSIVFIATSLAYFAARGSTRRSRGKSQSLIDDNGSLKSQGSLKSNKSVDSAKRRNHRSREKVEYDPPPTNSPQYGDQPPEDNDEDHYEAQLEYQRSKEERRRIRRERRKERERVMERSSYGIYK